MQVVVVARQPIAALLIMEDQAAAVLVEVLQQVEPQELMELEVRAVAQVAVLREIKPSIIQVVVQVL
jgi:hypothetical protein